MVFYELNEDGEAIWEDEGVFGAADVHRQVSSRRVQPSTGKRFMPIQ